MARLHPRVLTPPSGAPEVVFLGWETARRPNEHRPTLVVANLGVVAGEGQNGHAIVELSSDGADFLHHPRGAVIGYTACRHEDNHAPAAAPAANIGVSSPITFLVPAGWWYRYRRQTIDGYDPPQYIVGLSGATWEYAL